MDLAKSIPLSCLLVVCTAMTAQANEWIPVTGAEILKNFMSGLKAERTLPNGEVSRGEYFPDGTGILYSWGAQSPRTWEIKEDDQLCFSARGKTKCYKLDRNIDKPDLYRVYDLVTGKMYEFTVTEGRGIVKDETKGPGSTGGAAAPSADELAAELSNPNTAVATMTFKNQFRWFEGDLPDADGQTSYTLLFQPSLPFVLPSEDKILWRPAVPILVEQPIFDPVAGGFGSKTGLGDIAFDLAYAPKLEDKSLLIAFGIITSLPTATNGLGSGQWTLGPEFLIGKLTPKWVLGAYPNHQWDVSGWTENIVNLTSIQLIYTYLPGGGWTVGSAPTITYDWEGEQWTVPLQINVGKTVIWNGRPWKLSAELNYYVEKADAFGPEWMFSFNIAPVVKNGLAGWFGLGN